MNNLKGKQEELDKKKYYSSLTARTDMSGKMEWCKGCLFRNDRHECDIPYEVRNEFNVCARQYYQLKKEDENVSGKARKRNNGKS